MLRARTAAPQIDPRLFGARAAPVRTLRADRRRFAPLTAADLPDLSKSRRSGLPSDLKLFAMTFVAAFLFVSILLG